MLSSPKFKKNMKKLIFSVALIISACLNINAQSINFDGQDDYVEVGTINLTSYTKEAWIYANASGTCNIISSNDAPFWLDGGKLSAANGFGGGGTIIVDPATFQLNVWTHVAVTYDAPNNTLTLYKNGVQVAQNSSEPAYVVEDIVLGMYQNSNNFNGSMDEVRIWNVALTQVQIQDNMNCSFLAKAGLVVNYTFDGGAATPNQNNTGITLVQDKSGNSNTGTLTNFTLSGTTSNWVDNVTTLNAVAYAIVSADITSIGAGSTVTFSAAPVSGGSAPTYQWMKNNTTIVGATSDTYIDNSLVNKDTITCMITSSSNCISKDSISNKVGITVSNFAASLNFDGVDDYVPIIQSGSLDNLGLANFTTEAWLYSTDNSSVSSIIRKTGDYNLYLNGGVLNAEVWPNGMSDPTWIHIIGSTTLSTNQWYHVAFTWNKGSGVGTLYINGAVETSSLNNGSISASEPLQLGASNNYAQYFNGNIDEVKFWNVTRSASEIIHDMNCSFVTGQTGLLANYNFNEGTPNANNVGLTALTDNSGNGNDGTLTNFDLTGGATSNWTDDVNLTTVLPVITVVGTSTICAGRTTTLTASGATTYTWSANAAAATTNTVSVNPTTTDTYTVTGANGACIVTDTIRITVKATPTVTTTGNTNICSGQTTTLTAHGATNYTWTPGNIHTTVVHIPALNSSTTFTLVGSTNGCSSTLASIINVTATPTVSIGSTSTVLCMGDNVTLNASGATTYTWSANASSATTSSVNLTPVGTDTYMVTGANGSCTTNKTATVTVNSLPTLSVSSIAVCAGNATTLTATGATTYTWSTTETTATITPTPTATTTDYTVTGTDNNNCMNTAVATVTVNALPTLSVTSVAICVGNTATLTVNGTATSYTWSTTETTVSISPTPTAATTDYTVTGTDNNNCINMVVATITVNALPTVSVTSAAICSGNTATLTANGTATSYTWSTTETTASISPTPTATTTDYTVTGTDVNSCTAMAVATITVNPTPSITFNVSPNIFCTTDPAAALTASPAGGAFTGTGVSAGMFDPATAGVGTYTITYMYTDGNNCSAMQDALVTVQNCGIGINQVSNTNAISTYPNPISNDLFIQTNTTFDNAVVEVYSMLGQKVLTEKLQNNVTRISLDSLNNAVYQIRVYNNTTLIYQSKIVKQQ
jgi:hypothetical protein